MTPSGPGLRRAMTAVLAAVALISGAILLLGDRFGSTPGEPLGLPVHVEARIAACVADESMRLIDPARDRCRAEERELASQPAGHAVPAGADGVPGYEIVTARQSVPGRRAAAGEARCPAGKVVLGGGVVPEPAATVGPAPIGDRMAVVASGPLPGEPGGGYGWTATVRNASAAALPVIVAAICAAVR